MNLLGVGVIGTGFAGTEHLKAFAKNPHCQIVGICGLTKELALQKRDELQLSCPVFDDYHEMVRQPEIDIVTIATPNHLHAEQTITAAWHGKHVFVEKPAALTLSDIRWMIEAVEKANVCDHVGFVLRWHPMVETVIQKRDRGEFGEIFCAEGELLYGELEMPEPDWERKAAEGGNIFLVAACHAFDLLQWIIQDEPVEVSAISTKRNPLWEFDITSHALVRFHRGGIGRVTTTLEAKMPYEFNLRVFGTEGTSINNQFFGREQREGMTFVGMCPQRVDVTFLPFEAEANYFVDCVRHGKRSHASLKDTYKVFEMAVAANFSAIEHRTVTLPLE